MRHHAGTQAGRGSVAPVTRRHTPRVSLTLTSAPERSTPTTSAVPEGSARASSAGAATYQDPCAKALAAGASCVMVGSLLAGTAEAASREGRRHRPLAALPRADALVLDAQPLEEE